MKIFMIGDTGLLGSEAAMDHKLQAIGMKGE